MDLISIIVPVYNVAPYLSECLDSIRMQSYSRLEVLLIDDGSTDDSGQICDCYAEKDARFRVIHQTNQGLGAARNVGIQQMQGRYLLFVDSDDTIESTMVAALYKEAIQWNADIAICNVKVTDELGHVTGKMEYPFPTKQSLILHETPQILLAPHVVWNKLYRSSLWMHSGIRFPEKIWYEDFPTTIKLLFQAENVVIIEEELYHYRQRKGSIQSTINPYRMRDKITGMQDIVDYFHEQGGWEQYQAELEFLAIANVYFFPSIELIRQFCDHPMLKELFSYIGKVFPNYSKNHYLKELDRTKRLAFWLLEHKQYRLLFLLFAFKDFIQKNSKKKSKDHP